MAISPKKLFLRAVRPVRRNDRRAHIQEKLDELDHMQSWIGGALPDHLRAHWRHMKHELEVCDCEQGQERYRSATIDLRGF